MYKEYNEASHYDGVVFDQKFSFRYQGEGKECH